MFGVFGRRLGRAFSTSSLPHTPILKKHSGLVRDTTLGLGLGALGDYLCQTYVEEQEVVSIHYENNHETCVTLQEEVLTAFANSSQEMDMRRCFAMSSFGGMYTGALCHYVYPWYPRLVLRFMPAIFSSTVLWRGIGCTVVDNFIHNPIFYIPTFYLYTDAVKGASLEESKRHLQHDWYVHEHSLCVWTADPFGCVFWSRPLQVVCGLDLLACLGASPDNQFQHRASCWEGLIRQRV